MNASPSSVAQNPLKALAMSLCWKPAETLFVVQAYYDESGEYDRTGRLLAMSMGGCISSLSKWDGFEQAWNAVLRSEGLEWFHMADFEAWQAPFDFRLADGTRDNERHRRLLNNLLDLLLNHTECFYGFTARFIPDDPREAHSAAIAVLWRKRHRENSAREAFHD